jgi:hypothetical protein
LAVKQAVSASLKTAERLGVRRVIATTPTLTPTWKALSSPLELPRLHRVPELGGRGEREVGAAVLDHHRELVAADARQHLALAQARLDDGVTRRSRSSPARWPKESLMRWKKSMSM